MEKKCISDFMGYYTHIQNTYSKYSKSFVNVRVSVISALSVVFQIQISEKRKGLNRVLF